MPACFFQDVSGLSGVWKKENFSIWEVSPIRIWKKSIAGVRKGRAVHSHISYVPVTFKIRDFLGGNFWVHFFTHFTFIIICRTIYSGGEWNSLEQNKTAEAGKTVGTSKQEQPGRVKVGGCRGLVKTLCHILLAPALLLIHKVVEL